jgi:GT2 family glycosyltransferase
MSAGAPLLSVIVSEFDFGKPLQQSLRDIERLGPGVEILPVARSGNRAAALNQAVAAARGEVLLFIPSFVDPGPDLIRSYLAAFERGPQVGMVYGDYSIVSETGTEVRQVVLAQESDLSEWSSTGYVTAMRRSVFASAGGYHPEYEYAEEYDLRLRATRRFRLGRLQAVLYKLDRTSVPLDDERIKQALRHFFTPESSPKKGYGYLFCPPEAALEIERAFAAEVRARGAYLEDGTCAVNCPHEGCRPSVSVIVPVYNRAAYLRCALASVLGGSYQDFEIIVVDGGSTDGTVEVVADFQRRCSAVTLVHNPSRLVATSLNLGLREARGKYIAQLDSDDEYTPSTLQRSVAFLEEHRDCALAISYYDFIDDQGRTLDQLGVIKHLEYDRNAILRTNGAGAVRVSHRCVLERLGGFDERRFPDYAEDYDMILRLSEGYAVGRVPEVLYRCRLHSSNSDQCLSVEERAWKKGLARGLALTRRAELNRGRSLPESSSRG